MTAEQILTLGQYRVGVTFNPSQKTEVIAIKQLAADAIDQIERMAFKELKETLGTFSAGCRTEAQKTTNPEAIRCYEIAEVITNELADTIEEFEGEPSNEIEEWMEGSQAEIEVAAMWAVKGLTKGELPEHLKK